MKMKNLMKFRNLLLMVIISTAMILGSCKKDEVKIVQGDTTALHALITDANALANAATTADYPQTAINNFKAVLQTVKTAAATPLTQEQVNNLDTQLTEAMNTFNTQAYAYIDEALHLNAGWHFDEGTGTTATSYSTAAQVATFAKGWVALLGVDADLPTWVDGVNGGKAIYLNNGAHLEVPYSTSFLPADITIAAWIKMDQIWENDIIVSQNYWWGYKFQTQSGGFPMITERVNATTVNDYDNAGAAVTPDVWTHVVVSLNSTTKVLKFYTNGELIKTYTEADGVGALTQTLSFTDGDYTYTAQPFLIGSLATDAEILEHANNFSWITTANLGCFKGAIDELKIYNIALADGQVSKLYNDEKP